MAFLNFLAGIALMVYGIRTLRKGSDRVFGARLRRILQTATQGKLRALMAGFLLSILIPSSTGVALISVEAISAGYVGLAQSLAVMLGANIGFTVTVQLLAFRFFIYNGLFLAAGMPLFLFGKRPAVRGIGQTLIGLGFLLLSIQLISAAVAPLKDNADVMEVMGVLQNHPFWLLGFTAMLKVLLQSATATIGIAIALVTQGVLSVNGGVAVVLGANIGIGVTALMAGFKRPETRRMAMGNLAFKVAGVAVCVPLTTGLIHLLEPVSPQGDTQVIANAHTLFNVVLAVVGLPVIGMLAKLLEKLVPDRPAPREGQARHLEPAYLQSPALALGQATQEILHMADYVRGMLHDARRAFQQGDIALCDEVQKRDDLVDNLNNEIKAYITKISEESLTAEESRREVALLTFANDLESIGDIIDKNLIDLARKKITQQLEFSAEGRGELDDYFGKVVENFEIATSAFATRDPVLAEKLMRHKHHLSETEREYRNRHFHRLHAGLKESFETSAIHLDALTALKRINSHLTAVAYPILERAR